VLRPESYVTPERPAAFWFNTYASSVQRFRDLAHARRADVLHLQSHQIRRGRPRKVAALKSRVAGGAHPYVVGPASLQRFFTVCERVRQSRRGDRYSLMHARGSARVDGGHQIVRGHAVP
jgi:hypothetical protein